MKWLVTSQQLAQPLIYQALALQLRTRLKDPISRSKDGIHFSLSLSIPASDDLLLPSISVFHDLTALDCT